MPRLSPIQESFAAGEISKRVQGRVSTDAYNSGLNRARNWHPLVQGPIRLREGSKYMEAVDSRNWISGSTSTQGLRVFTFRRGIDKDIIVEIGVDQVIIRNSTDGGGVTGGVSDQLIPGNQYVDIGSNWIWDIDGNLHLVQPKLAAFGLASSGTPDAHYWTRSPAEDAPEGFKGGEMHSSTSGIPIPAGSELELAVLTVRWQAYNTSEANRDALGNVPYDDVKFNVRVGTAPGLKDLIDSDIVIDEEQVWKETEFNFVPGAGVTEVYFGIGYKWVGPGAVPFMDFPPNGFPALFAFFGVHTMFIPLSGGSGSIVEFDSPYTAAQLECLQFDMDPGEQVMTFTHPEVETHRLRLSIGEWTFEPISSITLPTPFVGPTPNNWGAGNHPAACSYHEGRLFLGGSPNDPATVWASKSGDYQEFNNVAPTTKADALLFPLTSKGKIQSLTSRKDLVINTDISEVVGTSELGVIAFDDFSFPKQSDWGSNCVKPLTIGREMVYTSASKRIIRTFSDEGGTNFGWDGTELSLQAQDIFGVPVKEMVFIDEPAYQVAFLLTDGTMGMATFFYKEEVLGWWRYATASNGSATQPINRIMSITAIDTSQGAKLWMVVNRVGFSGTDIVGHELVSFDSGLKVCLDTCAIRSIDPITGFCIDIAELDDQTVDVVVERYDPLTDIRTYTVHPQVAVAGGVSAELDDWAKGDTAYLGHFFDNDIQLLPLEGVSNRGTSQVSKRRWNKVFLRLNDSIVPLVEGQYPKDRTPSTLMGTGEPFITDDVEIVDLGSGKGDLSITQDKPLATEITGLFGKVRSSEV
jgi:hypothetical protein